MATEGWTWRFERAPGLSGATGGDEPPRAAPVFPTQADAESWLGEEWRALLEDGVESVRLLEGDHEVYGPMSLRPA